MNGVVWNDRVTRTRHKRLGKSLLEDYYGFGLSLRGRGCVMLWAGV